MQAAKTRRALCPVVELELIPYLRIENWAWQLRIANSKLRLSWCHTKLGSTLSRSSPHRFRWKQIVEIFDVSGKVKIDKQINFVAFWVNWLQSSVVPLWDAFPWNLGFLDNLNQNEKSPDRVNLVSREPLPEFMKAGILLTRFLIFSHLKRDIVLSLTRETAKGEFNPTKDDL